MTDGPTDCRSILRDAVGLLREVSRMRLGHGMARQLTKDRCARMADRLETGCAGDRAPESGSVSDAAHLLSSLLAVVHRDGGQHESAVGTAKATEDAMARVAEMIHGPALECRSVSRKALDDLADYMNKAGKDSADEDDDPASASVWWTCEGLVRDLGRASTTEQESVGPSLGAELRQGGNAIAIEFNHDDMIDILDWAETKRETEGLGARGIKLRARLGNILKSIMNNGAMEEKSLADVSDSLGLLNDPHMVVNTLRSGWRFYKRASARGEGQRAFAEWLLALKSALDIGVEPASLQSLFDSLAEETRATEEKSVAEGPHGADMGRMVAAMSDELLAQLPGHLGGLAHSEPSELKGWAMHLAIYVSRERARRATARDGKSNPPGGDEG